MDYSKFIIFVIIALLSTPVFSTAVDLSDQSNFAKSSSGLMWATKSSGAPTGQLVTGNRASVPFSYNVPNGQSLVPVSGLREANITLSRVGSAVGKFAQKVGPVGLALGTATLICELSDICDNAGEWFFGDDSIVVETYPTCESMTVGSSYTFTNNFGRSFSLLKQGNTSCELAPDGYGLTTACAESTSGCPFGEAIYQKDLGLSHNPEPFRPATEQDFIDAEIALNNEQFIQPLFDAGEPLPIDQPDPFPPVNTITGSTTKTIKDGDGNIIGTEVTEKTLTVTDTSDANSPNLVDVKETTKVSTYDQNNNLTGESTSVSEPPPPPTETQNEDIEFDNVNDTNLDTHDVDLEFTPQSWGSGTCPPDIDIATTLGGTQTLSMQPVCDFATSVNPIVLVMSSLIAMYLVSGVRLD